MEGEIRLTNSSTGVRICKGRKNRSYYTDGLR